MKSSVIIKVFLLGIIALSLLLIMIAILFGNGKFCSFFWSFGKYDKVELYNETFDVADIEKLDLNLIAFDVTIRNSEDDNVRVIINGKEDRKDKISIDNDSNVLKINESQWKSICLGFCFSNDEVIIYLPKDFNKEIKIKNTSGDITFLDSYLSNMDIQSVSGDIIILEALNLKIKSVSGEVTITKGDNIEVNTTSGDISVDKALVSKISSVSGDIRIGKTGNVELNTISGDIDIDDLVVEGTSNIETKSGEVKIDRINETYVETKTTSGDVSISYNDRKSENTLNIKTISGDIVVR